jgi:hypothetical protein
MDNQESQIPLENSRKLEPHLFEVLTFGHLPIAIDWLWIQCMLDPSIEPVKAGEHPQLFYNLDLVTDLDPYHFNAYEAGANLLAVVRNDGIGARDLLLKAQRVVQSRPSESEESLREKYWGKTWKISVLLGYVYLFELNDMPHAAQAFVQAAQQSGAPPYLENLAKRLQKPGGQYEVGIRLVNAMLLSANDPRLQEELEKKRMNLSIGYFLYEMNHTFAEFLKQRPGYLKEGERSKEKKKSYWKQFLEARYGKENDPWGGILSLDPRGNVVSSTPHDSVFGLE